jgi:hypothetical protein
MTNIFSYSISETECLVFRTELDCFHVYSKHESTQESHIATYKGGKWIFENMQQRQFFFLMFERYRVQFSKAVKAYNRSLREKPHLYEFRCLRSKFSLKVSRVKRNMNNWFYDTFYGR